jgi:glycosyltransferase involved in cell wall biosynthesis
MPPYSWLAKINRSAIVSFAKMISPYLKYSLFGRVFSDEIAKLKPDIVHAHDLICLKAANDAAKICGADIIYDAHELEVHRNPPLPFLQKCWVSYIEKKYARRAAVVNTVGRMVGGVLGNHLGRGDINIVYNSPLIQECSHNIRKDLNLSHEEFLLIYVGKVTTGRGVSEIMAVLPKLDGVFFATVGPCDKATRRILEQQAERLNISDRFRILPSVPFEQVVSYIRGSDLGVISVEPITLSYRYCMPNKLFELSFANVPIISNKLDEIQQFLGELGNGQVIDFENSVSLPYTIARMLQEKENYLMTSESLRILHDKYSWKTQSICLMGAYDRLLAKRLMK